MSKPVKPCSFECWLLMARIFGVIVVEKHPWNPLLCKEGSKPTGVYRGSKMHGTNFSTMAILVYRGSSFAPWHTKMANAVFVPNPVKWRANQVQNIQLKHISPYKMMSLSSLVPLLLLSDLCSNSPALITSHHHPKGTQNFGTQTAKLLSSFTKCSKQTLIFWNICSFTEPLFF